MPSIDRSEVEIDRTLQSVARRLVRLMETIKPRRVESNPNAEVATKRGLVEPLMETLLLILFPEPFDSWG